MAARALPSCLYMKLRPIITLLLTITLMINATTLAARKGPDEPPANKDEEKISAQEEREARELVAQLSKRWQETEDIGPLVDEFYVKDFAERLRHEPQLLYFTELKKEQLTPETSDDLRRHYVAMLNLVHLFLRLYAVYETTRTPDDGDEQPLNLKEIFPANVLQEFESNPALKALIDEEAGESSEGQGEPQGPEADKQAAAKGVETIEQLRRLTTALERAVVLLREHVKTLPSTLPLAEIMRKQQGDTDSDAAAPDDSLKPRSYILSEEFYGYPAGTRLVCVDLLPFHIDLVRSGQYLKVLSIHIQSD